MPESSRPLDVALAFTKAWTSHDMARAATFVSEDVVFEGPLQQSTGSGPYLKGLTGLSRDMQDCSILAAYGDEDQALVMYDLITRTYGVLTCAKLFTVREGKIVRDKLTFDSHLVRGAKAA